MEDVVILNLTFDEITLFEELCFYWFKLSSFDCFFQFFSFSFKEMDSIIVKAWFEELSKYVSSLSKSKVNNLINKDIHEIKSTITYYVALHNGWSERDVSCLTLYFPIDVYDQNYFRLRIQKKYINSMLKALNFLADMKDFVFESCINVISTLFDDVDVELVKLYFHQINKHVKEKRHSYDKTFEIVLGLLRGA